MAANALVKALEEANHKCKELVGKRHDTQAAQEKCEVEQREAGQMQRWLKYGIGMCPRWKSCKWSGRHLSHHGKCECDWG